MAPVVSSSLAALAVFTTLFSSSSAAPAPAPWGRHYDWNKAVSNTNILASYTVPLTDGKDTLPDPSPLSLKVITLGRGTQNYTCASSTAADAPVSIGAVATLINAGVMLPFVSPAEGKTLLDEFPTILLDITRDAIDASSIEKAGKHFFNAAGVPEFDLSESNNGLLIGKKMANISAPATATQGPNGAVPWLELNAMPGSENLGKVYRTTTASGNPPKTCEGQPKNIEIQYAAQYFFYV